MSWNPFRRRERELDAELRFHLDQQIEEHVADGLSPDEARRQARIEFGGTEQIKDSCRDIRRTRALETLLRNVRYGVRSLWRSPGFTAVAIASLALGIGANTAVFQLLDAVRLRPLPVAEPAELAEIHIDGGRQGFGNSTGGELTYPLWEQIREHQEPFSGVFAWTFGALTVGEDGDARTVRTLWLSGEAFDTLGVIPLRGRLLSTGDDVPGCAASAVVSHGFWQRHLGGRDDAIGTSLFLDGTPTVVVGVTPPEFFGLEVGRAFDVALPFCVLEGRDPQRTTARNMFWIRVFGRLAPGRTVSSAAASLQTSSVGWFEQAAPTNYTPRLAELWDSFRMTATPRPNGVSRLRDTYTSSLWLLLGLTGLVLAIACGNLANLTLARTLARGDEVATRMAIGAARRQVVSQLFVESLLLSLAGAVAGGFLAGFLSSALLGFVDPQGIAAELDIGMNWSVLAVLASTALAACLFFGLSTAIYATRGGAIAPAVSGGRGASTGRRRLSFQQALVVGQLGVSLVLVASSFLFLKSFRYLVTMDAGFRQEGIVHSYVSLPPTPPDGVRRFVDDLLDAVRAVPGIEAASTSTLRPLSGGYTTLGVRDPRTGEDSFPEFAFVSPGYFDTMEIPILAGRDFSDLEGPDAAPVAIVNQRFARRYFGDADPIGQAVRSLEEPGFPETVYRVVGLVADTLARDIREGVRPMAYVPTRQEPTGFRADIVTRSSLSAATIGKAVQEAISRVLPGAVVTATIDLRQDVLEGLSRERLLAWLAGFFGVLAISLAGVGLYGVVAYMVSSRRREIGIRMALGADARSVVAMVLGQTARLALLGCLIGVGLSLAVMRSAEGLLFGVASADPLNLGSAVIVLLGVALTAAYLPGHVAARTNPVDTLRNT